MRYLLLLVLFGITACEGVGGTGVIDPKSFLDSLAGPSVPTVQNTMLDAAKAAEAQGDYKLAISYYQQALAKEPENKDIALALTDAYRRSGDFDRTIPMYDDILTKDPNYIAAKEGKALALMAKGDFDTPGTLFQEVMAVDSKRWKTLNGLGILFTTRGLQSEAQQYFQEALVQNPGNISIQNNIGLSKALDRQFDAAIGQLEQAASQAPVGSSQRRHVDLNLAMVYAAANKLDAARAIAEQYFKGPELDNNLGLYAYLAKDDKLAKAYLNMALTESKTFYQKAWDNLQKIEGGTPGQETQAPIGTLTLDKPAEQPPAAKPVIKSKPKTKPKTDTSTVKPLQLPEPQPVAPAPVATVPAPVIPAEPATASPEAR